MNVGIAMPKREEDRQRLRAAGRGHPLPALYPDGVERPCAGCGLPLDVGPRLAALAVVMLCPWCAAQYVGFDSTVVNLGNPDSKFER